MNQDLYYKLFKVIVWHVFMEFLLWPQFEEICFRNLSCGRKSFEDIFQYTSPGSSRHSCRTKTLYTRTGVYGPFIHCTMHGEKSFTRRFICQISRTDDMLRISFNSLSFGQKSSSVMNDLKICTSDCGCTIMKWSSPWLSRYKILPNECWTFKNH
jgi:hypothetical protein